MADITGIRFTKNEHPWPSYLYLIQFEHPITANLTQDLIWGTDSRLGPQFYIDDVDADILGQVVFAQGTCKPGFGIKAFPEWTSIYCAVPDIPASVLREIAKFADVHLFSEKGDVLYGTPNLFGVHTLSGGGRTFYLPEKVDVVYDLFEKSVVAKNTDSFDVFLNPATTSLYYTGKKDLIYHLQNHP